MPGSHPGIRAPEATQSSPGDRRRSSPRVSSTEVQTKGERFDRAVSVAIVIIVFVVLAVLLWWGTQPT
jgi:hypothetical protein